MQADLANTLEAIAKAGPRAFYAGPIAEKIASAVQAAGGVMTADDLKDYRAVERAPVRGTYRGYDVVSMPPPSSGGVVLVEMLNILEGYDLAHEGEAQSLFLMTEAMKRAYADRAWFLGDPDVVHVPLARLTAKSHAAEWRATIDPARATPAGEIRPRAAVPAEGGNTTHFSVVDSFGNAVANTYTLNFSYGVGLVAAGTGVLLNNELDDFAAKPDAPNAYGLLGYQANAPGPGKRPLSSMTPTIVLKDGKPFLVTGSPGGSLIINAVLQVAVDVIDRGMDIAARRLGAARAQSVDARPDFRRAGRCRRSHCRARSARRQGHGAAAADVGQLDPGHAHGPCRRRRSAHARRARGGILSTRTSIQTKRHPFVPRATATIRIRNAAEMVTITPILISSGCSRSPSQPRKTARASPQTAAISG